MIFTETVTVFNKTGTNSYEKTVCHRCMWQDRNNYTQTDDRYSYESDATVSILDFQGIDISKLCETTVIFYGEISDAGKTMEQLLSENPRHGYVRQYRDNTHRKHLANLKVVIK